MKLEICFVFQRKFINNIVADNGMKRIKLVKFQWYIRHL